PALYAKAALDEKSRELLAAYFGEHREQIGRAAVGDPHLLAIQDVVCAVWRQIGPSAGSQRVGTGMRLGQRIGGQHFHIRELGQVLALLLFVAEEQQWQSAD